MAAKLKPPHRSGKAEYGTFTLERCTRDFNEAQVVAEDVDKTWTEILVRGQILVKLYL